MHFRSINFFSKEFFVNFLIILLPFSFIAGNLSINLNVIILIFITLFFFRKNLFQLKFNFTDKLIFYFFAYLILVSTLSTIYKYNFENLNDSTTLIKSWAFLRFLLLYLTLRLLITFKIINLRIFFVSCSAATLFICLDLIFQFIFGYNFFGYVSIYPRHTTGMFGDEAIAGSFLQRFSLFCLFLIPLLINEKIKSRILIIVLFSLIFFSIGIAGNRMPLILFLLTIFLTFFLIKDLRKYLLLLIILVSLVFTILYNLNSNLKTHYGAFVVRAYTIVTSVMQNKVDIENPGRLFHGHFKEFYAGYETWKKNKIFGEGVKSFKLNCPKTKVINCAPHPHNYYLEIMADLGLVGLAFILLIYINVLLLSFLNIKKYSNEKGYSLVLCVFLILFFAELFPIKTTGSFFTTGNATYLFFILAVLVSLLDKEKYKF